MYQPSPSTMSSIITPVSKHSRDDLKRSAFPPLPLPTKRTPSQQRDDGSRTIGTTVPLSHSSSFSEFSFQTPSTATRSVGAYADWSVRTTTSTKSGQNIVLEGIPKFKAASPLRRKRDVSPSIRTSPVPILRYYSSPSNYRASPALIKLERKDSILDLTDSEDEDDDEVEEDDSVIDDNSLRKLIRVTSHTLSEQGKILEEESSLVELHPYRGDLEDDGLNNEWKQLQDNEDSLRKQMSFEVDKVAYGHESVSGLNEKFVTSRRYEGDTFDKVTTEEDESGSIPDNFIGLCICCGNGNKASN